MLRPRLVLAVVPIVVLSAFLFVQPLSTQAAPGAQPSPPEVISDAPVCVRFYPDTGETREGPEICATRPGEPPPPVGSPATGTAIERQATPVASVLATAPAAVAVAAVPSSAAGGPDGIMSAEQRGPQSGMGAWWRRLTGGDA